MSAVNENSDLYYGHTYWNDIPAVLEHINRLCSNDPGLSWVDDFKKHFAKKPFRHGLFILCGNGWVEREFIDKSIVQKATAFDYSQELLDQAETQKGGRDVCYFQADVNAVNLPVNQFDLIVNVAGLHHVQYLYRFHNQLYRSLETGGVMVSFDYVGPSRNQYNNRHWSLVRRVNQRLPEEARAELRYPDLRTMLRTDPTEAINSQDIFRAQKEFFSIIKRKNVGGGLAYLLLTHNMKFFQLSAEKMRHYASAIVRRDVKLTRMGLAPNLFSYWVGRRKSLNLMDEQKARLLIALERFTEPVKSVAALLKGNMNALREKMENNYGPAR